MQFKRNDKVPSFFGTIRPILAQMKIFLNSYHTDIYWHLLFSKYFIHVKFNLILYFVKKNMEIEKTIVLHLFLSYFFHTEEKYFSLFVVIFHKNSWYQDSWLLNKCISLQKFFIVP